MKRVTYKDYAGVSIKGDVELGPPGPRHMDAASWLTAQVESGGKFGTVISYDGTGMTAGIHQAIAVYPRELSSQKDGYPKDSQGPLWKLLHRCFQAYPDLHTVKDMQSFLEGLGFCVVNGVAKDPLLQRPVDGYTIREQFTGSADGVMPHKGPGRDKAELAAGMFSVFFSDIHTHSIQLGWGEEHLLKRIERVKLRHSHNQTVKQSTVSQCVYNPLGVDAGMVKRSDLPPELDLAMSVWMSFIVNAPSIALRKMAKTLDFFRTREPEEFSKELIHSLGTAKWGRWDAGIKYGRYQRTRNYAMKVWPEELFVGKDAIMPKELR